MKIDVSKRKKYVSIRYLLVAGLFSMAPLRAYADSQIGQVTAVRYCAETIPNAQTGVNYCDKGIVKAKLTTESVDRWFWFDISNTSIDPKLLTSLLLTSKSTGSPMTITYDSSMQWFATSGKMQAAEF